MEAIPHDPAKDPYKLGEAWRPSTTAWTWHDLVAPDGTPAHVLRITTMVGVIGVALTDDALRLLITQGQERLAGLALPGGTIQRQEPHLRPVE